MIFLSRTIQANRINHKMCNYEAANDRRPTLTVTVIIVFLLNVCLRVWNSAVPCMSDGEFTL